MEQTCDGRYWCTVVSCTAVSCTAVFCTIVPEAAIGAAIQWRGAGFVDKMLLSRHNINAFVTHEPRMSLEMRCQYKPKPKDVRPDRQQLDARSYQQRRAASWPVRLGPSQHGLSI